MTTADSSVAVPRFGAGSLAVLKHIVASPRLYVYLSCTVLAILTSYHLGKEMLWDTMDYHVYAGFSALHDRFGKDYFAAGPQGYFNPYAYVPFYLLIRSALTPLEDASILAALQSGILWATFEVALLVGPRGRPGISLAIGMLAVVLAFANPVMINELGSTYADITTAEIALAGWLVLLSTVRVPGVGRALGAALLLGAASALKLTNSVHAVAAGTLLLFIPGGWRRRLRHAAMYFVGVVAGFLAIAAPWSLRLERHFGNPLFPLLNGVFRSPDFTTAPIRDYRFVPHSIGAALLRPFAMLTSAPMVHFELPAPDLRYALLVMLALLLAARWAWGRLRYVPATGASLEQASARRMLAALGCGFVFDWTLWLVASGNSRYFIPMACVAAVLCVVLVFRVTVGMPKTRTCVLAGILGMQCFASYAGADYRARLPWTHGSWFSLSVPLRLKSQPSLYFSIGEQSNSFIVPDLPAGSGFVNLDGAYVLGSGGASGHRIRSLIERYAPHLRVVMPDPKGNVGRRPRSSVLDAMDDALEPFGMKAVPRDCSMMVARGVTSPLTVGFGTGGLRRHDARQNHAEYLITCGIRRTGPLGAHPAGQRAADLALDHLEDACPTLLQPRRPADTLMGNRAHGYVFARRYSNTHTVAWVARGRVEFGNVIGGREEDAGAEKTWEEAPPHVSCGWTGSAHLTVRTQ